MFMRILTLNLMFRLVAFGDCYDLIFNSFRRNETKCSNCLAMVLFDMPNGLIKVEDWKVVPPPRAMIW
jgi:hypothetical protein